MKHNLSHMLNKYPQEYSLLNWRLKTAKLWSCANIHYFTLHSLYFSAFLCSNRTMSPNILTALVFIKYLAWETNGTVLDWRSLLAFVDTEVCRRSGWRETGSSFDCVLCDLTVKPACCLSESGLDQNVSNDRTWVSDRRRPPSATAWTLGQSGRNE